MFTLFKDIDLAGKTVIHGSFVQGEIISPSLQKKLLQGGVPRDELERFLVKEAAA